MKKFLALALAACTAVCVMSGCQAKGTTSTAASGKPVTACVGSEPKSIDPAINQAVDGATYIIHTFEGLTATNKNNQIGPGVAEKWETSSDGLTWTFHLRTDAKWSDGKAVTAGDFVYAWQRAVDPSTASTYAYQLYYIKNAEAINSQAVDANGKPEKVKFGTDGKPVQDAKGNYTADANGKYISAKDDGTALWLDDLGIKAKDDHTVVVTLEAPCAYFTQIAAFPTLFPVRKDVIEKNPDKWATDPKTFIGNGPYVISSWTHNSKIVMTKNANYWNKKSIVSNEIDWFLMDDDNSTLAAYKNGQILLADSMPTDEIAALEKSGDCKVYGNLGTYYLDFNTTKAPFNNVKVREAFNLAYDREYLVKNVAKGGQKPATGFVPIGISDAAAGSDFRAVGKDYYKGDTASYKANIEKAKQLLSEAGYPGGKGFPTVEYKYNTNAGHKAIAEYLQNEWQTNLGVHVTLQNEEWAVLQTDRNNKNYQISRDGWLGDYVDPMTFVDLFTSKSGNNATGFANAEFDKLVSDAKKTSDQKARMTDMHKAEDLLMENMPISPVYFYTDPDLVSPKLQGYVHSALGFKFLMWASVKG
jgi:oligopeptide transport system substrate-binding protein